MAGWMHHRMQFQKEPSQSLLAKQHSTCTPARLILQLKRGEVEVHGLAALPPFMKQTHDMQAGRKDVNTKRQMEGRGSERKKREGSVACQKSSPALPEFRISGGQGTHPLIEALTPDQSKRVRL
mmetsp:Transcript_13096/g.25686  ORF Transcript_13096/g.25686 Transcript_13096/m.25686 type:complete len:124 (-) Transcript_13096:4106-4477(-)